MPPKKHYSALTIPVLLDTICKKYGATITDSRNGAVYTVGDGASAFYKTVKGAVKVGDELYYGSEAIHQLALASKGTGLVGPMSSLFRNRHWAHWTYPLARAMRNGLLKILGKTRINNLQHADRDRF